MLDLRHAVRALGRTPSYTVAAIATLALGIGATTAIFSLVNAVLLAPVPYPDSDRLFVLTRGAGASFQSGQLFTFVRSRATTVEVAAQRGPSSFNLLTADTAVNVVGLRVSSGYFRTHGSSPLVGREFSEDEDRPDGPDAVVISHALWQRVFSGRVDAIGATIRLGSTPHTLVGVMPADFVAIPPADVLVPLRTTARDTGVNYRVFGRLHPNIDLAQAQNELTAVKADAARELGLDDRSTPRWQWSAYRDVLGRGLRQPLIVLFSAVSVLLVVACVNVASLSVARAVSREREMATCLALGAGRIRLLSQLFGESLINND